MRDVLRETHLKGGPPVLQQTCRSIDNVKTIAIAVCDQHCDSSGRVAIRVVYWTDLSLHIAMFILVWCCRVFSFCSCLHDLQLDLCH